MRWSSYWLWWGISFVTYTACTILQRATGWNAMFIGWMGGAFAGGMWFYFATREQTNDE